MRIIEEGQLPENKLHEVRCKNCKTLFEFETREGKYENDRDGDFIRVPCPLCSKEVIAYPPPFQNRF